MTRQSATPRRHPKRRVHQTPEDDQAVARQARLSSPVVQVRDDERDDRTVALFFDGQLPRGHGDSAARLHARLEWIFLRWAWNSGIRPWEAAVRSLARTLRGLERAGLIERRTLRPGRGQPIRRTFTLTAHGREVAALLAGRAESGEVKP